MRPPPETADRFAPHAAATLAAARAAGLKRGGPRVSITTPASGKRGCANAAGLAARARMAASMKRRGLDTSRP